MSDCIFCKIAHNKLDTPLIYQNPDVVAFHDINPQAPCHILIIPREHISTLNQATDDHIQLLGQLLLTAQKLAKQFNIAESGYRTLINCNPDGGQAVYHIHLHLLGGRPMQWPPG